jgi:large subunit ribosomal protein L4
MNLHIPFYKNTGEKSEPIEIKVDEKKFEINPKLISQAIHVENNRLMVKPGLTKTKSEISGGGRKPWKQKGTGRARAGSNRSPLWRGGGITFGPTKENKVLAIPKKMKEKALIILLIEKIKSSGVSILEDIKMKDQKTKQACEVLNKIYPGEKTVLTVCEKDYENTIAWRNLDSLEIKSSTSLSLSDLNSNKKVIFTLEAFELIKNKIK